MSKTLRMLTLLLILGLLLMLLTSCAPGVSDRDEVKRAGFFWGIWHGWIAPVSLIWQLFNPAVRIYEVHNTGWWYDLGFYLAIIGGFGSLSLVRSKR